MKESEKLYDCKITLVGDSGVGKTSIIGRYVTGIFMQEISSTAGLNYSHKFYEKNGKKLLNLNLWDTAGQEKFRSLDISNKESFENIKEIWYPDIEYYGEKIKILALVGNKKDKYEEEQISEEEAKSYAEEINAKFFLVSANTGEGIDNLFSSLADNFLDKEFKDKVDGSKLVRIDSIFLNKKDMKNGMSKSHNKCC